MAEQHKNLKEILMRGAAENNDAQKVSVLFYTSRSDRKILDHVLSSVNTFAVTVLVRKSFLLGKRSPAASHDLPAWPAVVRCTD